MLLNLRGGALRQRQGAASVERGEVADLQKVVQDLPTAAVARHAGTKVPAIVCKTHKGDLRVGEVDAEEVITGEPPGGGADRWQSRQLGGGALGAIGGSTVRF